MAILIFAISVLSFLYSYVGWKLLVPLQLLQPWKTLAWAFVYCLALLPLVTIGMRFYRIETGLVDFLAWLGYLFLGFVSLLFFFLLIKDLAFVIGFVFRKVGTMLQAGEAIPVGRLPEVAEQRRQFLWLSLNMGIVGVTGIMTGFGYLQARYRIQTFKVTIPFRNLPPELEGFRIIQISDLHVGPTIKHAFVEEVVDRVKSLNADLVVLTGDLVDGSVEHLGKEVEALAQLQPRYGKYFITGNHEYYSGVLSWLDKVAELGFEVLLNEHRVIDSNGAKLILGGVTDISAGQMMEQHRSDPVASLEGAPDSAVKILLAHQPISVYEASKAGYHLQLSGHTHGGQYFPFSQLVKLQQPFLAGLYRYQETWLYVNRGTGYWGPPLRIGPPAEITEIVLSGAIDEPTEAIV